MDEKRDNRNQAPEDGAAYSDAYYRQAPETRRACYGYNPAQCYARASEEPGAENKKKRSGVGGVMVLTACVLCVLMAALIGSGGLFLTYRASAASDEDATRTLYEELTADSPEEGFAVTRSSGEELPELTAEEIYTRACSSTVGVTVPGYAYNIFGQSASSAVTGTGIVLSEDGYILTNFHVIQRAYESGAPIVVMTYDGREQEAEVVGVESDSDLAVLKTDLTGLAPAVMGDSEQMRVGQTIYTVGNPLGELTYTMTSGIVSALDRRITTDENVTVNMFQIDAAVNSGNSGGPVFNVYGQVIGVVTAKYTLYGMEGLGFAIPMNDACRIVRDLVDKGYVTGKAYLGLQLAEVSPGAARYYDMVQGVYIYSVEEGSCAQEAGLAPGDIITAIGDVAVTTSSELVAQVRQYRAGDSAELTVWRDQEYRTVTVVFDEALPGEPSGSGEAELWAGMEYGRE